jgi:hypothetical protein
MALQLVEQLLNLMPELKEVQAWPAVGQRRTIDLCAANGPVRGVAEQP